jgi:glycosyltransferase involved in cell wall biosynthesis
MAAADAVIAVNARFLAAPITGIQRYARELVVRLPDHLDVPVVAVPPRSAAVELTGGALPDGDTLPRLDGVAGHAWEQVTLPRRLRALGAGATLSPANAGPLRAPGHVVVLADASPFLHPDLFSRAFLRLVRATWPRLARRAHAVVTLTDETAGALRDHLGADSARIVVVPPAVDLARWRRLADSAPEPAPGTPRFCLTVGGHDPRKNVGFLTALWPEVHARTGLELVVTRRRASRPHPDPGPPRSAGVVTVDDPDDATLARLYRDAVCVLSPSRYEGFGLPLLEAMACGTPFLATDTGAAAALAVDERQILPLDPEAWHTAIGWLAADSAALVDGCRQQAAGRTWDRSAARLATALDDAVRARHRGRAGTAA